MPEVADQHAARRTELLAPVRDLCAQAGVTAETAGFQPMYGSPVAALRCLAGDGSWDAAITVVRARPLPERGAVCGQRFVRHPRAGYDLDTAGELVYEVLIREDDDGGSGHGPRPVTVFELVETPQAAADALILWVSRPSLFGCQPPAADPDMARRWERRRYEHRRFAAAAARVGFEAGTAAGPGGPAAAAGAVAAEAAAAVDPVALCWHFPRERSGRYRRSAVVALAPCTATPLHLRSRWLTARADGERLLVGTSDLIPANQQHRWDLTPWLWDRRHAQTPQLTRWQVARPEEAAPAFEALRSGAAGEALALAGVQTEPQLTRLLAGEPARLFRARLTATWVTSLYAGLADAAPWRLAAAHQAWRESREAGGLPARHPVTLFGLGGMGQSRKPKVALDATGDGPILRLRFTGSNAVLPRSLWTLPADLAARLYGWPGPPCCADR